MQEYLNDKSVVVIVEGSKITARMLAKAVKAVADHMNKVDNTLRVGRESYSALNRLSDGGLAKIGISKVNIGDFEPYARKYGVSYALRRDSSSQPPKWLVFFRAKDTASLSSAFTEFANKHMKRGSQKRDITKTLEELQEAVLGQTHHRQRERERTRGRSERER